MTSLTIKEPLADKLREIARRENRPVEAILETMVEQYHPVSSGPADEDIEIPDDIQDKEGYRQAAREMRPKLYEKAREYWTKVGDIERLAMSDDELHKVFWLIDHEGIPRFKSEKDSVILPPDPLEALIGLIDSDQTDLSSTIRETMDQIYREKYERTD